MASSGTHPNLVVMAPKLSPPCLPTESPGTHCFLSIFPNPSRFVVLPKVFPPNASGAPQQCLGKVTIQQQCDLMCRHRCPPFLQQERNAVPPLEHGVTLGIRPGAKDGQSPGGYEELPLKPLKRVQHPPSITRLSFLSVGWYQTESRKAEAQVYRNINDRDSRTSLLSSPFRNFLHWFLPPLLLSTQNNPTAGSMSSNSTTEGGRPVVIFREKLSPIASRSVP